MSADERKERYVGAISPDELLRQWTAEELPTERAIGQVVQHLARLQTTLDQHSQALGELRVELARLHGSASGAQPAPAPRRRSR